MAATVTATMEKPVLFLNPTLWRTCKMLAGNKRVRLLRQLYEHAGRNVSDLGSAVGIKRAYASQELRRIQSRGLLKAARCGRPLIYRLEADPQVPSAAPLLKAIQSALRLHPASRDPDMCAIANGLAHERRMAIAQTIMEHPCSLPDLQMQLHLSPFGLAQHLRSLEKSGFAEREGALVSFKVPTHPLARTLADLLKQAK